VQRLFSTFPSGWPGWGLLLLRCQAGLTLIHLGWFGRVPSSPVPGLVACAAIGAGLLLLAGLWTPVAGSLGVAGTLGMAVSIPDALAVHLLLGVVCGALVMLGPGAWSIDARLFGRTRLEIKNRFGSPPG
jgi:putative oxidoreductase